MSLLWLMLVHAAPGAAPPPIVGGEPVDSGAVVLLVVSNETADLTAVCSGSRLDAWTVLTAAHCVLPGGGLEPARVQVVAAASRNDATGSNTVEAESWSVHPDYDADSATFDVALLLLAEPSEGETVALLRDAPREGDVGAPLQLVGFGATGDADDNENPTRRAASVPLYEFDSASLFTWDPAGEMNACFGDSGGAMFAPDGKGEPALAGVIGFVSLCEGGSAGGARSDKVLPWLRETVAVEDTTRAPLDDDTGITSPGECGCATSGSPHGLAPVALFLRLGRRRNRRR